MSETRLFTAEPDPEIARKNQAFLNRWTPLGGSVIRPFFTEPVKVRNAERFADGCINYDRPLSDLSNFKKNAPLEYAVNRLRSALIDLF